MLYPADFEQQMIGKEKAALAWMTAWLSDKPADVWLWFAETANWDTCTPILTWMVRQSSCDRAVLATIFWMSDPQSLSGKLADPVDAPFLWDADELALLLLGQWREKHPPDSGLKPETMGNDQSYRAFVDARPKRDDPLHVPQWLFGPFGSRPVSANGVQLLHSDSVLRGAMDDLGIGVGPPTGDETDPIKRMLALETPEQTRERKMLGLLLMTPALLMLGWYLFF